MDISRGMSKSLIWCDWTEVQISRKSLISVYCSRKTLKEVNKVKLNGAKKLHW